MKISDLFKQTTQAACGALSGALTLKENVESKIDDISKFISDDDDISEFISISVNDTQDSAISYIAQLSKETFNNCMNDNSITVQLPISDDRNITLTGNQVINSLEEQITNLKIQNEFLNYCCDGKENVNATDFITRVNNNIGYTSPDVSKLYLKCIELSSTPVEALKNFFGCTSMVTVDYVNDEYIEITDLSEYGGSAWSVAFNDILSTVSGFFDNCWEGITKIGKFFENIITSLGKVGKWLFQKAFSYLFTVYTKEGSYPNGYMDLPLLQVTFTDAELLQFISDLSTVYPNGYAYPWNHYGYKADITVLNVKDIIQYLTTETIGDTNYNSTVDLTIPSKPYSMLLRIGRSDNTHYIICVYACFTIEETSACTDADIEKNIWHSLYTFCETVSSVAPMVPKYQDVDDTSTKFEDFAELMLTYDDPFTGNLAKDLNDHLVGVSYSDLNIPIDYDEGYVIPHQLLYGLICYAGVMSRKYINNINMSDYCIPDEDPDYEIEDAYLSPVDEFDDTEWNVNTYRPYFKSNLVPCSVHYQTTAEQAREVEYTLIGVLLAATIVVATVKVAKFRKKLTIKSEIAQANVDRLSWDAAANPSSENMQAYIKARKKNNKIKRFQRLLGMLPKADVVESTDITNLVEGITPVQNVTNELNTVRKLLK